MAYARVARTLGFLGRILPNRTNENTLGSALETASPAVDRKASGMAGTSGAVASKPSLLCVLLPFIIAMVGLIGGIYLVSSGYPVVGLVLGLVSLVGGMTSAFVYEVQYRRAVLRGNREDVWAT